MKIAALVSRILLGLMFVVFGANKLYEFMHAPMPTGPAGLYMVGIETVHMLIVVGILEVVGGALLLVGRYVPLALVLLGPVIVNILLFNAFLSPQTIVVAIVVLLLWFLIFWRHRAAFAGIFAAKG
jgi:putative oxidoreductase